MPLPTHTATVQRTRSPHRAAIESALIKLSTELHMGLRHPGEVDSWMLASLEGLGPDDLQRELMDIASDHPESTGKLWDPIQKTAVSREQLMVIMARWTLSSAAKATASRARLRLALTRAYPHPSQVDHIFAMTEPLWHLGSAAASRTLTPQVTITRIASDAARWIGPHRAALPQVAEMMERNQRLAGALQNEASARTTIKRMMHLHAHRTTPAMLTNDTLFSHPSVQRRLQAHSVLIERTPSTFVGHGDQDRSIQLLRQTFACLTPVAKPVLCELERSTRTAMRLTSLEATSGHEDGLRARMHASGRNQLMSHIAWDVWAFMSKIAFFDDLAETSYDPAHAHKPLTLDIRGDSIFDLKPDQAGAIAAAGLALCVGLETAAGFLPEWCNFWTKLRFHDGQSILNELRLNG